MREKLKCEPARVASFLHGMNDHEQMEFERHLDQCDDCRKRLDDAVASPEAWGEIHLSLATDSEDTTSPEDDCETTDNLMIRIRSLLGPTDDPAMVGRIGSYEIIGLLGTGGMGIVLKGLDVSLNRCVAIKILAPVLSSSGLARQRFLREARAAAAVVHEHVVPIHAVSEWRGTPFIVMPYIRGTSLARKLADHGLLPLRDCLRIGMQVASGLAAAHAQGLIHRDIKPANVMLEHDGDRVQIMDFGLARAVDDIRLTRTDAIIGTPQYMSPEQARDEALDFRTDLFSLGAVLYETVTGRPPFRAATSYGVIRKIADTQPQRIRNLNPEIPEWFETLIDRLLAKNPADRIQSAAELNDILRSCLAHIEQPQLVDLPSQLRPKTHSKTPRLFRRIVMLIGIFSVLIALSMLLLPQQNAGSIEQKNQSDDSIRVASAGQNSEEKAKNKKKKKADKSIKFDTAEKAWGIGVALYKAKDIEASREPFEAALELAPDNEFRLKVYEALLPVYREIPEFEPFLTASEFIITHSKQDAHQSLTRRALLSFAYNRGQLKSLTERYEERIKKDDKDRTAVYILSEIYTSDDDNAQRSIELIQLLEKLDAVNKKSDDEPADPVAAAKIVREKGKLAGQYMKAREYEKSAKLYEEIAPLDPATHAWNLKEAAGAWLKNDNKDEARRLALAADEAKAESRNDQLAHFFHRNLGDVLLAVGEPEKAADHFKIAIEKTTIEGYVKDTKASLQEATEAMEKKGAQASKPEAKIRYPWIVSTQPAIGETNVDSELTEITITFDRDMGTGMSWTGGGPEFPELDKSRGPSWVDKRTCVLPVILKEGSYYRVGINSKSNLNFKSADGEVCPPAAIFFTTKGAPPDLLSRVQIPTITEIVPANGADNVLPSTKEIRVTFDMPMGGGMSWTGGGEAFPEVSKGQKAQWSDDGRTCTLPVSLLPNHDYLMGLNSLSHNNFQSKWGVPLVPVYYSFRTAPQQE